MNSEKWAAFERDMLVRQDLAPSTVRKTRNSLERLEREGLDLLRPRRVVYEDFIMRRKLAGARTVGLIHYYNAVRRLLKWRRIRWPDLECPRATPRTIHLPSLDVVKRLMEYPRDVFARDRDVELHDLDDQDAARFDAELANVRFAFQFAHYTGARPPSEHVAIRLRDFNETTGELRLWSTKVDKGRTLVLEPWLRDIIASYIQGPRRVLAKGGTDALLVNPFTGGAWTRDAYRQWLTNLGKLVSPSWYPYVARHWCATWRLVETDFDCLAVQVWMGHEKFQTTQRYIHVAQTQLHARMLTHGVRPLVEA